MKQEKWFLRYIMSLGIIVFGVGALVIGMIDLGKEESDEEIMVYGESAPGEESAVYEAGAAVLFGTRSPVFTQNQIVVTEAEKIYGANKEVLSETAKQWREVVDAVGNVAVTTAGNYVNIRDEATSEGTLIGKAYTGAVVNLEDSVTDEEGMTWYHITSGQVEGYACGAYFLTGEELIHEFTAEEEYLKEEYITNKDAWKLALTLEEDRALKAVEAAEQAETAREEYDPDDVARRRMEALAASDIITPEARDAAAAGDTSLLRAQMIEYASQFLGNRYINGGKSLVDGTDCSGFTCFIYRDFGYSIDRTPAAQYQNAGRSISLEEARPGDIVCYGKSSVTHVALYMGDGKIIHSANSRKGVVIYDVGYDNIIGVKSIMD